MGAWPLAVSFINRGLLWHIIMLDQLGYVMIEVEYEFGMG